MAFDYKKEYFSHVNFTHSYYCCQPPDSMIYWIWMGRCSDAGGKEGLS